MNNTTNQNQSSEGLAKQFCIKKFKAAGSEVVNSFRCDQSRFITTDLWNVQKQRKEFPRPTLISLFN